MSTEWIASECANIAPRMIAWRRDFHKHPEIIWREMRTSSLIARALKDMGYEPLIGRDVCKDESRAGLPKDEVLEKHYEWAVANGADPEFLPATKGGFTGVIAELKCGEGPTIAFRFDIDALGISESKSKDHLPTKKGFASINEGIMHGCGHDGHAAIGLGTAALLMAHKDELHGTIRFIFQPGEESTGGARAITEAGHLDDVDYVMAAHIFPRTKNSNDDFALPVAGHACTLACSGLDIIYRGKAAHAGAIPQNGHNAMLAASTATLNMLAIPRYGSIVTQVNVGTLRAGTARNVICDKAFLEAEVRGGTDAACEYMQTYAKRVLKAAAQMHECDVEIRQMGSAPALVTTEKFTKLIKDITTNIMDLHAISVVSQGIGSEDYSYFSKRVIDHGGEAVYVGLLCDCAAINHDTHFDFDESVLQRGAALFCNVALKLLG